MEYSEIEILVVKAKSNDKLAVDELIKYFTPFIKNFSRKVFIRGISAEDIEQDCYLELINIIHLYDPGKKSFLGFLYTSLRNNIFAKYKKQLNIKQIELKEEILDTLDEDIEIGYINEFIIIELYKALNKLSPLEKDVLIKYYFEKIPLKEQAKRYKKSYMTLVKRKEVAINKLKNKLNKIYN